MIDRVGEAIAFGLVVLLGAALVVGFGIIVHFGQFAVCFTARDCAWFSRCEAACEQTLARRGWQAFAEWAYSEEAR